MPSAKHTRRPTRRPTLPHTVPEDLPGWSWAQNGAGELALVAPGGESTAWFLLDAEQRAYAAARSYQAERPHLVACHAEAAAVAQTGWVAHALPAAGWELHPRGTAQSRVATDDAGLRLAVVQLQVEPQLDLGTLVEALRAVGRAVALVGDGLAEVEPPSDPAEQGVTLPAPVSLDARTEPAATVRLELPGFDRRAFAQEWRLVQEALSGVGAAATLALLHAAQARLSEAEGREG